MMAAKEMPTGNCRDSGRFAALLVAMCATVTERTAFGQGEHIGRHSRYLCKALSTAIGRGH